jgi:hypothetical protein
MMAMGLVIGMQQELRMVLPLKIVNNNNNRNNNPMLIDMYKTYLELSLTHI